MEQLGRAFILIGCAVFLVGVLIVFGDRLPVRPGRLPLDFRIERGNFSFYLPLGTSLILSVILSLIFMVLNRHH